MVPAQVKNSRKRGRPPLTPAEKGLIISKIRACKTGKAKRKVKKALISQDTTGRVTKQRISVWLRKWEAWHKDNPSQDLKAIPWKEVTVTFLINATHLQWLAH